MLLMPVLLAQALSSCSLIDDPEPSDDVRVKASLAFSLAGVVKTETRQADEILQINDKPYRGMQDVKVVPFAVSNPENGVQITDMPKVFAVSGVGAWDGTKPSSWFYYYNNCSFIPGTNAVLFYGRATVPEVTDPDDVSLVIASKAYYGSVIPDYPADMAPANIKFSLEQMYENATTPPEAAQSIGNYLTNIARANGWSTTSDSKLRALYLNFTGQGNQGNAVIAGSSASVTAYVNNLKTTLVSDGFSDVDNTIKAAILSAIGESVPDLGSYPSALGLPDGAAALRWNSEFKMDETDEGKGGFVAQTVTTTEAAINSISRFTFPAELYYYGNCRLYTSNVEVKQDIYSSGTNDTWAKVLASYPNKGTVPVSTNTKAVALEKPVQYAMAHLQMDLTEPTVALIDAKNQTVPYKQDSEVKLPLTGIIIGGQHTVGYDFKPEGDETEFDLRFIYDKNISGMKTNTLVFQSYDNEKVKIILEFENNTGSTFVGKDGIIYPGTKFYLIGEIDPSTQTGTGEQYGRVFTQDHTTEVNMTFTESSLASAYNVVPDLLSPRLEIGIRLVSKWIQTEPTNVPLD